MPRGTKSKGRQTFTEEEYNAIFKMVEELLKTQSQEEVMNNPMWAPGENPKLRSAVRLYFTRKRIKENPEGQARPRYPDLPINPPTTSQTRRRRTRRRRSTRRRRRVL